MGKKEGINKGKIHEGRNLYEQVADHIAGLIEGGTFRPGERIPSVRKMSAQRRVSISTVLQAYGLLENLGLIEARPQSGYYVRARYPSSFPEPDISSPDLDPSEVSIHDLTMMVLRDINNPKLVQLGAAIPNPDLLPMEKLNRILSSLTRVRGRQGIQYDVPPGCKALRVQVAQKAVTSGCRLTPDDIVTTSGCMEAFDISLRAICHPGDTVAIESPTYFGILQSMESMGLQALEIPTHPREGISLDALSFALEHHSVRACLVVSNFNNPLGCCIPDANKKELVRLLEQRDIPLIEIDVCGDLHFEEPRPSVCKSYDQKGLVMLCSSFSKVLCPGYRVGWVAPGRFKSEVEWLKYTSSVATATFPQLAVARFLDSGGYDHHLRHIRRAYALNISRMSDAVMHFFPEGTRVTRPSGGFVLWIQLPDKIDSLVLYKKALKAGITLSPGYIFSATQRYRNFIRLNAAFWDKETERAIARLGDLIREIVFSAPFR